MGGRAEPAPPRGGQPEMRGLAGKAPKITPKVVFSEGRAPRVRMARLDASRGISLPAIVGPQASGLTGIAYGWNPAPIAGVQSPPLVSYA